MHSRLSPFHHVRRLQERKSLQPKTSCLGFTVSKLPGMDDLVGLANSARNDANRILERNPFYGGVHQLTNKFQRRLLPTVSLFFRKVPCTRYCEVGAWRVSDHQVPFISKQRENIPRNVERGTILTRQKIARPSIVTKISECLSYAPRILAPNEHFHPSLLSSSRALATENPAVAGLLFHDLLTANL